ncbi:MAG TPA: HAD family hydrolase, partial [Spirochaetia bacterium]|nr:HAD family hydrolase [Spirochaetia bacterium]
FARRCSLYSQFCDAFDGRIETLGPGTQLLVIEPPSSSPPSLDGFEKALPNCSIIRTTSPLDGASHWIEIFPKGISKGQTTDWLAKEWGLGPKDSLAIGNDYNDLDLLKWSHRSFVVANAPPELRREFDTVASVDRCGVTEAVRKWLPLKHPGKP